MEDQLNKRERVRVAVNEEVAERMEKVRFRCRRFDTGKAGCEAVYDFLFDGSRLRVVGVGDEPLDAVNDAHDQINAYLSPDAD